MKRWLGAFCLLAGCSLTPADMPSRARTSPPDVAAPVKTFARSFPQRPEQSNAQIARDFMDLTFQLESGARLNTFTRFEGPIDVVVTGRAPPTLEPELTRLLRRLRREAGIPIARVPRGPAQITISAVPSDQIRETLPSAACFVAPNVTSLGEFHRKRGRPSVSWTRLSARHSMAIFVPNDASPQELRDCLHEELAQALGPVNDLYRLPASVFNDDNVHSVLTGFDMVILRATYDDALKNGMRQSDVVSLLPGILARINPAGQRGSHTVSETPAVWNAAVQQALSPSATFGERRQAAARALSLARQGQWSDNRAAFSHYVMGRALIAHDPVAAGRHFRLAASGFETTPNSELHRAFVAAQLAALHLRRRDGIAALTALGDHLRTAARFENAALLATLQMLQAEALALVGQDRVARQARLDSLGWARYGFGPEWAVEAKLREIASLVPAAN